MITVKRLKEILNLWEEQHNSDPMNEVYLGKFEDMPIVGPYYKDTETRGLGQYSGIGPLAVLNNPHCLGIEFVQNDLIKKDTPDNPRAWFRE